MFNHQLIAFLVLTFSFTSFAGERVILKDSKKMQVEISQKTVRCSGLGYGFKELKINLPQLDGWTILDHTNVNFGDRAELPCMTAGICKGQGGLNDGFSVADIVMNNPRLEWIEVERTLTESRIILDDEPGVKKCFRHLREDLKTTVAGVEFTHTRVSPSEVMVLKACHF